MSQNPAAVDRAALAARLARSTPPHAVRNWPLPRAKSDAIEALRSSLAQAGDEDRGEQLARFRERLLAEGTPLVEHDPEPDRCRITFVWIGQAEHGVVLQLNRLTDTRDIADTMLERIARVGDAEVHALTLRLPREWQGSYLFVPLPQPVAPNLHDPIDLRVIGAVARFARADPFARERIPSKAVAASAAQELPEYAVARGDLAPSISLWKHDAPAATGLGAVSSPANGSPLDLHHWATPGADEHSPVVLLLDGEVWREQFPIAGELAALRERRGFGEAHLLFLDSGGPMQRELDYAGAAEQSGALLEAAAKLVAGAASSGLPGLSGLSVAAAARWIVAGQSLGGLFAAFAATRHPKRVRAAVAQSPSLWWPSPSDPWQRTRGWFEERAEVSDGAPVLLEAGAVDAGVVERARSAAALLRAQGSLIDYREHPAGHDVLQWQADLVGALAETIRATEP